jgi:ribose/xylose/arabinose/galactoside ABC-type transport system permease subunit/ABC-type sugar transport system substrate-binding protein
MKLDRRTFTGLLAATAATVSYGDPLPKRTIAVLFDSLVSSFWVASLARMRCHASLHGWSVLEAVSNLDDNVQYQQVQSMIQRKVDGIIIIHTDDKAVIPAIRAANAAGIPMVHFNRPPAPSDAYSVAVIADNRKIMRETVIALFQIARRQGSRYKAALLIGDLGDTNGVHRRDGFQDAIEKNTDIIEVVSNIVTEWNADKAFSGLTNALQAHPEINMIVSSSDFMTPQIQQALRAVDKWKKAGEPGHILIASFDGDPFGYAQLADGYYDVDGVQNMELEVQLTFEALEQMWRGIRPPKVLIDPGVIVTRENLLQERDQMWGYTVWKAELAQGQAATAAANSGTPLPAMNCGSSESVAGVTNGASSGAAAGLRGLTIASIAAAFLPFVHSMFSVHTLHDVLLAMLPLAVLVVGQTLVMLVGQIDLSMTAVMALSSVIGASVMTRQAGSSEPWVTGVGVIACLIVGLVVGLFNGACSALLRIPSFIATLSVMMFGGGAAVWYASHVSDTISIGGLPQSFLNIGFGTVFGIPIALILCGTILIGVAYLLAGTLIGRWVYAVGHNAEAARISGVPVKAVTLAVFAASGVCAAMASIIYTSRMEAGLPTLGQNMLLDIVGAAVIGGVSLFGGRGNVLMALCGVLFLSILDKALQLLGLSLFLVLAVKGTAILLAAGIDVGRRRKAGRAL